MHSKLNSIWTEVTVARYKILSQHLPVSTEENYETPRPGYLTRGPRYEHGAGRNNLIIHHLSTLCKMLNYKNRNQLQLVRLLITVLFIRQ
jgi:hypothetical protein